MEKIIIGSDKSGFVLKEAVKAHLIEEGYEVTDAGPDTEDHGGMYYLMAQAVAPKVAAKEYDKGILICGTGMGMNIVSNKFPGVYAAVCENTYAAEKARSINDANILTMGGWITAPTLGCAIADKFLTTEFTQNLEDWRANNLRKAKVEVKKIEERLYR